MKSYTETVSTETLLQVVADPRRRAILHHLIERDDDVVEVAELTESVATNGDSECRRRGPMTRTRESSSTTPTSRR